MLFIFCKYLANPQHVELAKVWIFFKMKQPLNINRISIDSLRSNITKNRLKSISNLNKKFWVFLDDMETKSRYLINQIERKRYRGTPKTNKSTGIQLMKIGTDNHAHSFLIAKGTQALNAKSDYKKLELSSNGLSQIHATPKEIYKTLYGTFKSLTISTIDLCIDMAQPLPTLESLKPFCDKRFIYQYKTSIYLNRPTLPNIERIVIYDKANKEGINGLWLRVEFTCRVNQKLRVFTPPHNQIYDFMESVFNQSYNIEAYSQQHKLLTDGRSYNKRIATALIILWLIWLPLTANVSMNII